MIKWPQIFDPKKMQSSGLLMYLLYSLVFLSTCKAVNNFDTELQNHHARRDTVVVVVVVAADAAA